MATGIAIIRFAKLSVPSTTIGEKFQVSGSTKKILYYLHPKLETAITQPFSTFRML